MPTIPRSLLVRGETWAIVYTKRRPPWVPRDACGLCDSVAKRMWIKRSANVEDDLQTLAHELTHTLLPHLDDVQLEEFVTIKTEAALYSLLRDNDLGFFCQRRR